MNTPQPRRAKLRGGRRPAPLRRRRGFTLVEMLVVVAVIALLASILLPSLSAAKESARRTVCLSNIRQLAIATMGYAVDNGGHFPLAAEDIWGANNSRWHGQRESGQAPFDPAGSPLKGYFGPEGQIKRCPSFSDYLDAPGAAAAFEAGCGGYGYNSAYVGGRADVFGMSPLAAANSARQMEIARPAQTVLFTDAAFMQSGGDGKAFIAYSFCETPFWQMSRGEPSSMRPNPTIHFRHRGLCNVAWADGHVDGQTMSFSRDYQTHSRISAAEAAEAQLGWFGPDSNELFDCR